MYWDRFDICEAYYIFLSENHSGQSSEKYKRLSKLLGYFKPRFSLSRDTLSFNAQEILFQLEARD